MPEHKCVHDTYTQTDSSFSIQRVLISAKTSHLPIRTHSFSPFNTLNGFGMTVCLTLRRENALMWNTYADSEYCVHSLLTFNKLNLMKVMTCNDNVFLWWGFHLNLTHTHIPSFSLVFHVCLCTKCCFSRARYSFCYHFVGRQQSLGKRRRSN